MKLSLRRAGSLSLQLTLIYTALSVSLVVLICWIVYLRNAGILESGISERLLLTVDQTVTGLNTQIEERISQAQMLTLVPTLREAAAVSARRSESLRLEQSDERMADAALAGEPAEGISAPARRLLEEFKEGHAAITAIELTDRYGVRAAATGPVPALRRRTTWWQEAVQRKLSLSNLEWDPATGMCTYSVALPLPDDPRPPLGVIRVVFNLGSIQELVRSVRIGHGGYVVVISREGRLISHPDLKLLNKPANEAPGIASVAHMISATPRGFSEFDIAGSGTDGGERWLVAHSRLMRPASLGPLDWTVAAMVSRAEVVAPILAVRNIAVAAGFVFILGAVPVVAAVSRRLSRPLADLAHRADRISAGELNVGLEVSAASDEIQSLARSLRFMVDRLREAHREALDINAGLERVIRERTEELQRKNRQIEAQNRKVMEASRLKSQFLANMSHELRTPLNAVLALSEILSKEMSGPLNDEQAKQVLIINRSGKSLLRLINDVLDLSKIEAGRMNVEKAPMSLRSLVTLVADTLRPLAEDKGLQLATSTTPDLPEFIKTDEQKLRQILINLVGNAIKFTERGSVRMEVSHTTKPAAIAFAIIDTGIGIPGDLVDRIFEEFCQGDGSTTRKYGGSGLGLTISKRMAELLGGTLTVQSQTGKGSTFTFSVPYEPGQPVPETPTETLRRVRMQIPEPTLMNNSDDSDLAARSSQPVVLVAEDESDTLYIMKKYLNKLGCHVVFARDGGQVLEKARQFKPIAITLDLVLPRKNGWDVLSELKTDPETRHIPVIISSVLDNQERGFCLGAYRYLVKPINEIDLADTIHQIQGEARKDVKRVLVIDDNLVDSDIVARLLVENRYDVLRAMRGEEGIATARREQPDLILLDLSMPGMDGFQVMEGLRRHPETQRIPVVIYTARDLSGDEIERVQQEAQSLFMKNPLDPIRMMAEIGKLLKDLGSAAPAPEAQSGAPELPGDSERGSYSESGKGLIMLVEDDSANQYTLQYLLRSEGYEVILAENGREALAKAASQHPELILMDMMMPVMGGHEATRMLRDTPGIMNIPVIALTAAAMTGDRDKALAAGCNDYVSKPVNQALLLERLEYWMGRVREARRTGIAIPIPPSTQADSAAQEQSLSIRGEVSD